MVEYKDAIIIICTFYIIYHFFFYNSKYNIADKFLKRLVINLNTICLFILGIILNLVFNDLEFIKNLIDYFYIGLILIHIIFFVLIKVIINIIYLFSKETKKADKGYKLTINLIPIACYLIIILM